MALLKHALLGIAAIAAAFVIDSAANAQNTFRGHNGNYSRSPGRRFSTASTFQAPSNFQTPIYNDPQMVLPQQFGPQSQLNSSGFRGRYPTQIPSNIPYQYGNQVYGSGYPYNGAPLPSPYVNGYYGRSSYGSTYYGTPSQQQGAFIGGNLGNAINGQ